MITFLLIIIALLWVLGQLVVLRLVCEFHNKDNDMADYIISFFWPFVVLIAIITYCVELVIVED